MRKKIDEFQKLVLPFLCRRQEAEAEARRLAEEERLRRIEEAKPKPLPPGYMPTAPKPVPSRGRGARRTWRNDSERQGPRKVKVGIPDRSMSLRHLWRFPASEHVRRYRLGATKNSFAHLSNLCTAVDVNDVIECLCT